MTVLVTGGTGKLGRRLVPALLESGYAVRVLVRDKEQPAAARLAELGAELVDGDVTRPETLEAAVAGAGGIVHLAAYFRGPDEERIREVNVEGTRNLAQAALEAAPVAPAVPFVFASTNLVYSNDAAPAAESDPVHPARAYPASKVEAEQLLLDLHRERGLDARVLRLAFVYGAGDPHLKESKVLFERWGWHPARRLHLVHHADIAQAARLTLRLPGLAGEIYNVADDAPVTVHEILAVTGESAELADPTSPLAKPWEGLVDTAKLRALGFRPLVPSLYAARDFGLL